MFKRVLSPLIFRFNHIDLDKRTITVNQTLKTYSNIKSDGTRSLVTTLQTPKNKHSIRVVPIPESLVAVLNKQKAVEKLNDIF